MSDLTYRVLLEELQNLNEEQLDMRAVVLDRVFNRMQPAISLVDMGKGKSTQPVIAVGVGSRIPYKETPIGDI